MPENRALSSREAALLILARYLWDRCRDSSWRCVPQAPAWPVPGRAVGVSRVLGCKTSRDVTPLPRPLLRLSHFHLTQSMRPWFLPLCHQKTLSLFGSALRQSHTVKGLCHRSTVSV